MARGRIDELVFGRLKQLGIPPARVCSDGVFVRRAYLDVIGTLPTPDEAAQFLNDSDPDKRRKLIDRLLDRDEFADYGAMKWCDLLRVKSEFPIKLWPNAVQAYHHWIHTAVKENMPYDRFARELLTASGSNFRYPQVNFYRAVQSREPQAIAQAVAFTFMGVRPAAWPSDRWSGMAAFFSQISYNLFFSVCHFKTSGEGFLSSTPALLARILKESPNSMPSIFITKSNKPPLSPQPKHFHICLAGETKREGFLSEWKGQRARKLAPVFWSLI